MKEISPLVAIIFSAVLAYVIGIRLSEPAMAVVIGVIFGVAASIPASILMVLLLRQTQMSESRREPKQKSCREREPVVIVMPSALIQADRNSETPLVDEKAIFILPSEDDVL